MYQIYPRSFKDSNGDGVGDLRGIIEKLDYLNDGTEKSLGVGAVWLSPIYRSPMKDFGYDVSDYRDIDPVFGDLKTFDLFVKEAHRRGIKVIMDFVLNHTSSEHPWFQESRASRANPKRGWYIWHDPKPDGSPPNNWLSVFGGPAWTYDKKTKQYYLHTFLPDQPDLNWRNKEVREEMVRVMEFWLHRGVDGFRNDAIHHLIKDDKFRDDPPNPNYKAGIDNPYDALLHIYSQGQEETLHTTRALCEVLGLHENKFMVSEVYLSIPQIVKFYQACENHLHMPFNFNFLGLPWRADTYRKFIEDFEAQLGEHNWPNYVFGNHDVPRLATRIGRGRARVAAMLQLTLRGTPFVYYGEELGMKNGEISEEAACDCYEKNLPGLRLGRDPERTPMQWTAGKNAGFSSGKPWLPVAADYKDYNVFKESKEPKSFLNLYKTLIHFRNTSPALLTGSYRSLDAGTPDVLAFVRECQAEKLLILLNFSNEEKEVSFDFEKARVVCNTGLDKKRGEKINLKRFMLKGNEGVILSI